MNNNNNNNNNDATNQYGSPRPKPVVTSSNGVAYVDYRDSEMLRRILTPNGKIQGRKRTSLDARQQRMVAQAIKRARHMALLPFTSATL